jgi:putative PIN family toxin of toxin-antitoxin system
MRIVADTNVLVSALVSAQSSPAQILALWRAGDIDLLVSAETLAELRRVLGYPRIRQRLRYTDEQLEAALTLLDQEAIHVEPPPGPTRSVDPDDDKFIALAVAGGAAYLVSGDRHLLQLGGSQGVAILAPAAFLAAYRAEQGE